MDTAKMEGGIRLFLEGLGQRFEGDDLEATPGRVTRAWLEDLVAGYQVDPEAALSWTPIEAGYGPVLVRGISMASICVHHLLPFIGRAEIAYLPGRRLAGLSKIGRVVDAHARRLQTQERLTRAIVRTLEEGLEPLGVIALVRAEHTCMSLRGVRKERSELVTLACSGLYDHDAASRQEIVGLLGGASPRLAGID